MFELPIEASELPNNKLGNIEKEWTFSKNKPQIEAAFDIIKELHSQLRLKQRADPNELYKIYDYKFNMIGHTIFQNKKMPEPEEIESEFDTEFDMNTHVMYRELCFRHFFNRVAQRPGIDQFNTLRDSWENYTDLFQIILRDSGKGLSIEEFQLPSAWIFDIIDEFIYQFTQAQKYRKKDVNEEIQSAVDKSNFWRLEDVEKFLVDIIAKSGILNSKSENKKINLDKKRSTMQLFGLYSIIGMIRLNVLKNDFDAALLYISYIDFDILKDLSRSVASYLTLFQYSAYCYLMKRRYREAVKLLETILNFFYKYGILLRKSQSYDRLEKQAERCLYLFTVSIYFKQININENISSKMKDTTIGQRRQQNQPPQQDKIWDYFQKILKFDSQAFQELLTHAINRMQIQEENGNVIPEHLKNDFEEFRKQTEFISILKLYSKLSIQKLVSLLQVSEENIRNQIANFQNLNSDKLQAGNIFETTIVRKLFNEPIILDITINGQEIEIRELQTKKDYKNIYIRNDEICREVISNMKAIISK